MTNIFQNTWSPLHHQALTLPLAHGINTRMNIACCFALEIFHNSEPSNFAGKWLNGKPFGFCVACLSYLKTQLHFSCQTNAPLRNLSSEIRHCLVQQLATYSNSLVTSGHAHQSVLSQKRRQMLHWPVQCCCVQLNGPQLFFLLYRGWCVTWVHLLRNQTENCQIEIDTDIDLQWLPRQKT